MICSVQGGLIVNQRSLICWGVVALVVIRKMVILNEMSESILIQKPEIGIHLFPDLQKSLKVIILRSVRFGQALKIL